MKIISERTITCECGVEIVLYTYDFGGGPVEYTDHPCTELAAELAHETKNN